MNKTYNCIKCGGVNTMEGLVAENRSDPSAKIRMIRLVCSKCGFTEIRMDKNDFAKAFGSEESGKKEN